MKAITTLLLVSTASMALTLDKGRQWTWEVVDRSNNIKSRRTAIVGNSTRVDSGLAIKITAFDSTTFQRDTGSILQFKDGRQAWLTGIPMMTWEPQPWNQKVGSKPNATALPAESPMWWGEIAGASTIGHSRTATNYMILAGTSAWPFPTMNARVVEGGTTADLPQGIWDDVLSVRRFRFGTTDWRALDEFQTKDSLLATILRADRTWKWEESTFVAKGIENCCPSESDTVQWRSILVWSIVSSLADSSGWKRFRIRESRQDSSDAAIVHEIDLRIEPLTGRRFPARGKWMPSPDDAWFSDWTDSISTRGRFRHRSDGGGAVGAGYSSGSSTQRVWIRPDGTMDSLVYRNR